MVEGIFAAGLGAGVVGMGRKHCRKGRKKGESAVRGVMSRCGRGKIRSEGTASAREYFYFCVLAKIARVM